MTARQEKISDASIATMHATTEARGNAERDAAVTEVVDLFSEGEADDCEDDDRCCAGPEERRRVGCVAHYRYQYCTVRYYRGIIDIIIHRYDLCHFALDICHQVYMT